MVNKQGHEEKLLNPKSGFVMLALLIFIFIASIAMMILGGAYIEQGWGVAIFIASFFIMTFSFILMPGLKIVNPNEAAVLTLFGKYYGSIIKDGYFWVNPFCTLQNPAAKKMVEKMITSGAAKGASANNNAATIGKSKLSLKAMTLNNERQKVNDEDGNPIEIGVIVIWRIVNTAKAVFDVDNYEVFVSTQTDSAIRHVARQYPYDVSDGGEEKSLRGSSQEIAGVLKKELQSRVDMAGIEVLEARISHLAYAPEIAAAMLQRQQASAVIAARQKIVEGAVGMVEMALNKLNENGIVNLDEERKAAMVSNLLVVLCGNKDAQPIVNSGSIY